MTHGPYEKELLDAVGLSFVVPTVSRQRAAPDVGVPAERLIAMEEQESKKLLSAFRERAGASPAALEFLKIGKPAIKIVEGAKRSRTSS
jgi:hypothetical protein